MTFECTNSRTSVQHVTCMGDLFEIRPSNPGPLTLLGAFHLSLGSFHGLGTSLCSALTFQCNSPNKNGRSTLGIKKRPPYLGNGGNDETEREGNLGDINSVRIVWPHDAPSSHEHQHECSYELCNESSPDVLVPHIVDTDHTAHSWGANENVISCGENAGALENFFYEDK